MIADLERVLGPGHPDTLTSRNNLAAAYQAAGRDGDAETLLRQATGKTGGDEGASRN